MDGDEDQDETQSLAEDLFMADSGFMADLDVERNMEEVNEVKKLVCSVAPLLLSQNLFDLLCCFTSQEQNRNSNNATTNRRDLYTQMAVNFKNVYDNLMLKNDFAVAIACYLPGFKQGEKPTWPEHFVQYVANLQSAEPTAAFVKKYKRSGENEQVLLHLNFGRAIYDSYKSTVAFTKKYFLPYWRSPKLDSGESITGVLNAIRERIMLQDATERAVAAVRVCHFYFIITYILS